MTEVNKKAEIVYGDLPAETVSGILYINDNGIISTVINNNLKAVSHELVSDIFANIENNAVIPTTQAVATYVDTKIAGIDIEGSTGVSINVINNLVSGKVDNNRIISGDITEANDVKIPTTQAVSTFVVTKINDLDKDYFIQGAEYDSTTSSIILTYNADKPALSIPVSELINLYTASSGLNLSETNEFSIKTNSAEDNKFIVLDSNGLGLSGITSAIYNADVALSSLLMTEVNKKQDILTFTTTEIASANESIIPTTLAVSSFVDSKINDLDKDYFIQGAEYDSTTSSIILTYNADKPALTIPVSDLIDIYIAGAGLYLDNNEFSIKTNSAEDNDFIVLNIDGIGLSGINTAIKNADIALSGLLSTYVDKQIAPKLDIITFESLSGEYQNADIALSGLLSTYVNKQIAPKLDITTFESLSGVYKNADIALSGLLSTYVDKQVANKLDITTFESLSGEYQNADVALSGVLSTYVDKQVSGKLAKSTFKSLSGEYQNADIALSGLLMTEVNKKQDILTFATTEIASANDLIIPTTLAVSSFVDSKIGNIDKDYFIQGAEYDSTTSSIILTYNADKPALSIPVSDLIDIYTAGDGLNLNNNEFSIKTNSAEDNKFIALDSNGFGLSGITTAITSYIEETTKLVELTDTVTATTYNLNYKTAQLFNLTLNTTSLTLTASNIPKNETILVYLTTTGCSIIYNSNEILSSIDEGTYILFLGNFSGTIQLIGNPILCS